jgi:hypothetical protein
VSEIDFLIGRSVEDMRLSNGLRIVFDMGDRVEPALYADIEQEFSFTDMNGMTHAIDPWERVQLGPALAIHGQRVEAVSTDGGVLRIAFSDRSALEVQPHSEYEAWQVVGGDPQALVVCVGPDDVAVWTVDTPGYPLAE